MKPVPAYILSILFLLSSVGLLSAQNCQTEGKVSWKVVEIKVMEEKDPPSEYDVIGESAVKSKSSVSELNDLSNAKQKKMKKRAAKDGSCLVYIDTMELWGVAGGLYYFWVIPKK